MTENIKPSALTQLDAFELEISPLGELPANYDRDEYRLSYFRKVFLQEKKPLVDPRKATVARHEKKAKAVKEMAQKLLDVVEQIRKTEKFIPEYTQKDLEPVLEKIVDDGFCDGVPMQETLDRCLDVIACLQGTVETANKRVDHFVIAGYGKFLKMRVRYSKELKSQEIKAKEQMDKLRDKIRVLKDENEALTISHAILTHEAEVQASLIPQQVLKTVLAQEANEFDRDTLEREIAVLERVLFAKKHVARNLGQEKDLSWLGTLSMSPNHTEPILRRILERKPLKFPSRVNQLPSKCDVEKDDAFKVDLARMFSQTLDVDTTCSPKFLTPRGTARRSFSKQRRPEPVLDDFEAECEQGDESLDLTAFGDKTLRTLYRSTHDEEDYPDSAAECSADTSMDFMSPSHLPEGSSLPATGLDTCDTLTAGTANHFPLTLSAPVKPLPVAPGAETPGAVVSPCMCKPFFGEPCPPSTTCCVPSQLDSLYPKGNQQKQSTLGLICAQDVSSSPPSEVRSPLGSELVNLGDPVSHQSGDNQDPASNGLDGLSKTTKIGMHPELVDTPVRLLTAFLNASYKDHR